MKCALLLAVLLVACSPAAPEAPGPQNLLLISIDTLRADHLPTYGYERETAPHIDALAAEAMVFDEAYSEAPYTLPAHTSLLTGVHADRHGVHDRGDQLPVTIPTLAELFAARGYRTAAFTNSYFVSPEFGLDRGFAHFDYAHEIDEARDAAGTNRALLDWFDTGSGAPYFVFVHYFDPHSDWKRLPYDAPEALQRRFAGDAPSSFSAGRGQRLASRHMMQMNREGKRYDADALRYVIGLYDAGIAYVDAQLGSLLRALRERDALDDTVVILVSDHGEEFQEHGRLLHQQIYQEHVRVPFLVSLPEMRGVGDHSCGAGRVARAGRSHSRVQLADVVPTLAACFGLELPGGVQGRSLLPLLFGKSAPGRDVAFDHRRREQRGLLRDQWKWIAGAAGADPQLFDLSADPGEHRDVALTHPEVARSLAQSFAAHLAASDGLRPNSQSRAVPEEIHQALEALGYER